MIATAMVACTRLGLRARYIGKFGDDLLGAARALRLLLRAMASTSVHVAPGTRQPRAR